MSETQRKFCRVVLEGNRNGENVIVLLTVTGANPIRLTDDGLFIRMHDVKRDKDHIFNAEKLIHIQIEDEREM